LVKVKSEARRCILAYLTQVFAAYFNNSTKKNKRSFGELLLAWTSFYVQGTAEANVNLFNDETECGAAATRKTYAWVSRQRAASLPEANPFKHLGQPGSWPRMLALSAGCITRNLVSHHRQTKVILTFFLQK